MSDDSSDHRPEERSTRDDLGIDPEEMMQELEDGFFEAYAEVERDLSLLASQPENVLLADHVFRQIASIKAQAAVCELETLTRTAQCVEDAVYAAKEGRLNYTSQVCDALLMAMDMLKNQVLATLARQPLDESHANAVQESLFKLSKSTHKTANEMAQSVVESITHWLPTQEMAKDIPAAPTSKKGSEDASEIKSDDRFQFFLQMAEKVDMQNPYWTGRTQMLLHLGNLVNSAAGELVDPYKLNLAICLHDFGMAFVPNEIIHKKGKLNEDEMAEIYMHPYYAAEFAKLSSELIDVAEMVMQHHERLDGGGYPLGIAGKDICQGARLIAILDAFFSMTNARFDRGHRRSLIRGITEINACAGTQFCPDWVRVFNGVLLERARSTPG